MLETVREFGLEQLARSGTEEETRHRLAAWCLALAEVAQPDLIGGSMHPEWVIRLDDELPTCEPPSPGCSSVTRTGCLAAPGSGRRLLESAATQ